jgi:hypothetical protein
LAALLELKATVMDKWPAELLIKRRKGADADSVAVIGAVESVRWLVLYVLGIGLSRNQRIHLG